MNSRYRKESDKRDKEWMDFLREERAQRRESMQSGLESLAHSSKSIDKMADSISEFARAMVHHDAKSQERHSKLIRHLADWRRGHRDRDVEEGGE